MNVISDVTNNNQSVQTPPRRFMRQYELIDLVRVYDPDVDEDLLNRAYVFSMQAHGAQKRASGDPYFAHPLEVAAILTEMKMDCTAISTALLHDTVEDTGVTLEELEKHFGKDISRLVDGVTKLSRISFRNDQAKQAENFRKLVLAMSEDIRVLLVKLADRLHNMRTLSFLKDPEKRKRIALETMDIYVPLAERIGIQKMHRELQDLAFAELHPEAYASIVARLGYLRNEGVSVVANIRQELEKVLHEAGLNSSTVQGREKTPWSIWRKMQARDIAFEQLSDIMAFRVFVDNLGECYQALGIIHGKWTMVPGRFKDYISTPKPNRYQSLHTGIIGPDGQRIEVQIRTWEMHEVAELGVAAHWAYKEGAPATQGHTWRWLRELLDIVEHAQKPEEFLEHTKLELFQDQVFCFTPRGDLIALPRNATPVDFAYAVHSLIGDTCVGVRVNGRMVPLRTQLQNGDQVEIITQKGGQPSPAWERFVVTGKARARLRRFMRLKQRDEYITLGRAILEKLCRQESVQFTDKVFEPILNNYQAATIEDLYANVGASIQSAREVFNSAFPQFRDKSLTTAESIALIAKKASDDVAGKKAATAEQSKGAPITLKGLIPGMAVHFARCCHPLPGDSIVGIVATGRGVTVHTKDCPTLNTFRDMPERWIDVAWGDEHERDARMVGRLAIVITNQVNSLGTMTTIIGKGGGNILNLKITNRTPEFFDLIVDVQVRDTEHMGSLLAALRGSSAINSVERIKVG